MAGKIGVLTFHKCINYGSYWQARCLVEGLRESGYDAEILDHHCKCVAWAEARCAFQPMLPERTRRQDMPAYAAKTRKFADAVAKLPLSKSFSLHQPEAIDGYETILVGSDEVWNLAHPWYGGKPLFYGAGLNGRRLISYAASFGSYSCHWGIHDHWADRLKRFDSLSVRDENSYWLVRGSTGREPATVLDPCLQFPAASKAEAASGERPYALVYGHSFPPEMKAQVKRWSRDTGIRLVSVGYRNGFADEHRIDAGPLEFAGLVAGARAVVTNFFHGCVFSLLSAKPFATTSSAYRSHKVRGLLDLLGAANHLVDEQTPERELERLLDAPPLAAVDQRLRELRESSRDYLHASLA